jgi:hypothetical protein
VGHRGDGGALAEQAEVLGAGAELEVGADEAVGLAAEGRERGAVDDAVEAGLGDLGGVGEVVGELLLGAVAHLDLAMFS